MITEDMSLTDLKAETMQDELWFSQMSNGWHKKYGKQLKNKRIKDGAILGTSHYTTPSGNSVYVVFVKCYYGENAKYARLFWVCLYEYVGNNGCIRYLQGLNNEHTYETLGYDLFIVYTEHCVQRFMERGNITMLDAFREMALGIGIEPYDYNGANDEYMYYVGSGVCFAKSHKWGYVATTYIHKTMEYANQLELHKLSMRCVMAGKNDFTEQYDKACKSKANRKAMNFIKQRA